MKLDKFIHKNCCNYVGSECIGVWKNFRFNNTTECLPLKKEKPAPCGFFEKIVLPVAIKLGCHSEVCDNYSKTVTGFKKSGRQCENCGETVGTGKRFCDECTIKKRKKRKKRKKSAQLSTKLAL